MGREFPVNPAAAAQFNSPAAKWAKLRVALVSVGAALFLTGIKAAVGLWTGSLALLSEAAHSALDLFASGVTALSVRAADRPADRSHPYGHGKIESLSALLESGLLLLTCGWILQKAITRLLGANEEPFVNIYSFLVIVSAIGIDLYRYRALMSAARKYHSQALEADALHFYSDILSSSLVFVGLIGVALGIHSADALTAMLVAVWVGVLAVRLGRKNMDVLLDRAPEGYTDEIRRIAEATPGVLSVGNVRLRRSGARLFADLTVSLDHTLSLEQAHDVSGELERRLEQKFPGMDVVVHTEPAVTPGEPLEVSLLNFIRLKGLMAHHLSLFQREGFITAELHLEVDANLTIREAHDLATKLEYEIARQFPAIATVQIHIEEIGGSQSDLIPVSHEQPELMEKIQRLCDEQMGSKTCHGIIVSLSSGKLWATLHCLLPGDLSVSQAHNRTTHLEEELHRRLPELDRVLIHEEPLG